MVRAVLLLFISIVSVTYCLAVPEEKDNSLLDNFSEILGIDIKKTDALTSKKDHQNDSSIARFIKTHKITFDLPLIGSSVVLGATDLENGEMDMKIAYGDEKQFEGRKKTKRIKKIFIPILVLLLLKALVLIPLALGVIGFKTWNAIQLSFISFVVTVGLAVWKLCTKISYDQPPVVLYGNAWDYDKADLGQQLAYSAYAAQ